jgi:glycerol-3-phosphate acyltransferase PlsY
MLMLILFQICAAYLIGSIPFGLILTQLGGYGDIRKIGSGNIGATNVLRTGNKTLAIATLLLDALKGVVAIAICLAIEAYAVGTHEIRLVPSSLLAFGLLAVIGHVFPVWLKFKGGKGVATALGVLLVSTPLTGLAACAIWLLSAFAFKISSLAALIATGFTPVITFLVYGPSAALLNCVLSILVIVRHTDNIARLCTGTEPKIGRKKTEPAT